MTINARNTITCLCLAALCVVTTGCGGSLGPTSPASPLSASVPPPAPPNDPPMTIVVSGVVTEMTPSGPVPVEAVYVEVCGYDSAHTDKDGFYRLELVPSNTPSLFLQKPGYKEVSAALLPGPNGRVDVRMERQ